MKNLIKVLLEEANESTEFRVLMGIGLLCLSFYLTGLFQGVL